MVTVAQVANAIAIVQTEKERVARLGRTDLVAALDQALAQLNQQMQALIAEADTAR